MSGTLAERLYGYHLVCIDTSPFIYHFEANARYASLTKELFSLLRAGTVTGCSSYLTLLEILVVPFRESRSDLVATYEQALTSSPNLSLVPIDRQVVTQAAEIRGQYGLKSPDAIQVASGVVRRAELFITNDGRIPSNVHGMKILTLDDVLGVKPTTSPPSWKRGLRWLHSRIGRLAQ